ncbi:uncharacterized protein LOC143915252 [Arctopsyche grandis]|uniref:uncharacterized protein LOC143915252 n=1 Tax=Arctopsyche grandis TaxID=121162 RepID=UPI00406D6A51
MQSNPCVGSEMKNRLLHILSTSKYKKRIIVEIKNIFRKQINSERRLEVIDNPTDLICILEKRNCFTFNHLNVFVDLIHFFNINDLDTVHLTEHNETDNDHNNPIANNTENPAVRNDMDKKKKVYDLLKNEIGDHWSEFARCLSVQESEIDRLSSQHSNCAHLIVPDIMKIYEETSEPSKWHINIMKALEKCRRNNLKYKVNEILTWNT